MLTLAQFKPVSLEEQPLFTAHYARYPQVHSDNLFTNMVCWNHFARYSFLIAGDSIVLSSTILGKTKFRPPIGPRDPDLLLEVFDLAVREGDEAPFGLVDASTREWIHSLYPDLPLHGDRDYYEYVYRLEDLARLSGGNYLSIRRQLNKFRKNCHPEMEEMSPANIDEVKVFLQKWCEWKQCKDHPFLSFEKDAVLFAIAHMGELPLSGLLIRVRGEVGAMAIFEELNQDTAVIHFEKGLPDCEGIYKAINAQTAAFLEDRYQFINRESDMGEPGLREAKTRYHPHHMVEVSYALKEDIARIL